MNKKIVNIISVIICTIVGAGFASGKEIYIFFAQYGIEGIFGIILSIVFMGIIIYYSLKMIVNKRINNNIELLKTIKAPKIFYYVINIFLLISFFVMIAGFSAYFKQEYNINILATSTVLCILLFIILTNKVEWIMRINAIIAPILLLIIICIITKYSISNVIYIRQSRLWIYILINAVLYASYNSIVLIPILIIMSKYIKHKREILIISVVSSIIVIVLAVIICLALQGEKMNYKSIDLPIIEKIDNKLERGVYGLGIEIAIFTSAVSAGYGFLDNIKKERLKEVTMIICICGIPISIIGFGNLINLFYPVFGALGLVQILLILKNEKGY